jgi:hypothetical protein
VCPLSAVRVTRANFGIDYLFENDYVRDKILPKIALQTLSQVCQGKLFVTSNEMGII